MPEGCWQTRAADTSRIISWQTRSPVFDLIASSLPQTLWVVGTSYVIGILIAHAHRHHLGLQAVFSWFDQIGTFFSMVGFSIPTFFTGTC
jgi:peptide/nickel transport system permease protein